MWLSENLTFDVDARVNLFEVNISLNPKLPVREPKFFIKMVGMTVAF